jgi:hypothetical protein
LGTSDLEKMRCPELVVGLLCDAVQDYFSVWH